MDGPRETDPSPLASELAPYETLDRRGFMVALKNRSDLPLDGWTAEYSLIVYENDARAIMAVGNWNGDGSLTGGICWGQGGAIEAQSLHEFLDKVAHYDSYYH